MTRRMNMSTFVGYLGNSALQLEKAVGEMQSEGLRTQKYVDNDFGVAFGCQENGKFPAFNGNHSLLVLFKGEIFNRTALAYLLGEKNAVDSVFSDGELFANLYERLGAAFLAALRGTFSVAMFDLQTRNLLLFRDRFGETPMYYTQCKDSIVFSPELNAIVRYEEENREIDEVALGHYLSFGYVPAPRTIFKDVHKLSHACMLKRSLNGSSTITRYWDLAKIRENYVKNESTLITEIYDKMIDCVEIRTRDLKKSGVLLSGGLDSGTIAALLARVLNGNVTAFSVTYEDRYLDETANSERIVRYLGIDHKIRVVEAEDIDEELIRKIVTLYGEPCAFSSVIASYFASDLSSRFFPTVFTGDGGDEAFLGYSMLSWREPRLLNYYSRFSLLRRFCARLAKPILEHLAESNNDRKYEIGLDFFERKSMSDPDPEVRFAARVLARFFSPEDLVELGVDSSAYEVAKGIFEIANKNGFRNPRLYGIINLNLIADTYKVGRSSHAFGISTRSPFLDHNFMEFMQSIPTEVRLKSSITKYLLRKILLSRKMLPREIIESKSKIGFEAPVEKWLNGDLRELAQTKLVENPILHAFKGRYIKKLLSSKSKYRSLKIWNLLVLSIWYDVFIRERVL